MSRETHFTFHILVILYSRMSDKKPAKKRASKVSTHELLRTRSFDKVPRGRDFLRWLEQVSRKRGFVSWLANYCKRSRRQLANLALKYNVPRAANGYNFDWGG